MVNPVYAFFETFAIIHAMTSGGPARGTEILVYKVFRDGVERLDLGGSSAQSVILMLLVITLTSSSSATSNAACSTSSRHEPKHQRATL